MTKKIVVGRNDGTGRRRWFHTLGEASAYIGALPNQDEVTAGAYYLDAPEDCTQKETPLSPRDDSFGNIGP